MYEGMSFDVIMRRMLDRIPNTFDKREGSVIYDALAPAAMEIMSMYIELENVLTEVYADTASREYLIKRAAERGIIPSSASNAFLKAVSTPALVDIPIGSRFSLNELNYVITEKTRDGEYVVQCETKGVVGNRYFGRLIPIDYISGLESVEITELLIPGEDEESTESIRRRYFESFNAKVYGGNIKDYIDKTTSISGVGAVKVTPVWNGGGTVLLTILDSEFKAASDTLVKKVQDETDPTGDAAGVGTAPIGHIVTVRTADETVVNINTIITFQEGYSWSKIKADVTKSIGDYLLEIRKAWADESASIVRISRIETRIMNIAGVLDVEGTKINGASSNLLLDAYSIPVFGVITNE